MSRARGGGTCPPRFCEANVKSLILTIGACPPVLLMFPPSFHSHRAPMASFYANEGIHFVKSQKEPALAQFSASYTTRDAGLPLGTPTNPPQLLTTIPQNQPTPHLINLLQSRKCKCNPIRRRGPRWAPLSVCEGPAIETLQGFFLDI